MMFSIKGYVHYIFVSLFFSLKESFSETRMFFISLQKLFSFLRKRDFMILGIQISWPHQMFKHKIRNTFYWITWEENAVC